jgi:hypothetical protein
MIYFLNCCKKGTSWSRILSFHGNGSITEYYVTMEKVTVYMNLMKLSKSCKETGLRSFLSLSGTVQNKILLVCIGRYWHFKSQWRLSIWTEVFVGFLFHSAKLKLTLAAFSYICPSSSFINILYCLILYSILECLIVRIVRWTVDPSCSAEVATFYEWWQVGAYPHPQKCVFKNNFLWLRGC